MLSYYSPNTKPRLLMFAIWMGLGVVPGLRGAAPAADLPAIPVSTGTSTSHSMSQIGENHPLLAVRTWANRTAARIEKEVPDYSAILLKRESDEGTLGDPQRLLVKVRHQPFSVYVYFYDPSDRRGDEAIYVAGSNDGNLLAHTTGITGSLLGTLALKPDGIVAMEGQRHPLTEVGILNLCRRIAQAAEKGLEDAACQVEMVPGQKVGDRNCRCIHVRNPDDRQRFLFSQWRVYVDDEWDLPIRFEAYDWPVEANTEPPLAEVYTYTRLKLNNGLTDMDFDVRNPRYGYAEGRKR
jgi:hypothetical protein